MPKHFDVIIPCDNIQAAEEFVATFMQGRDLRANVTLSGLTINGQWQAVYIATVNKQIVVKIQCVDAEYLKAQIALVRFPQGSIEKKGA